MILTVPFRAYSWRDCRWRSSQGIVYSFIMKLHRGWSFWLRRISWKQRLTLGLICSIQPRNMVKESQKLRCRFYSLSGWFLITYRHRGRVIKELKLRREDLVITTKIFWGPRQGHSDGGLARKQWILTCVILILNCYWLRCSIIEGLKGSLKRLGLDYVDVVFAHRCDHTGTISHYQDRFLY